MTDLFRDARSQHLLDQEHSKRRSRFFAKLKGKKQAQNQWSVEDHQDYLTCGYSDKQQEFGIFKRKYLTCPAFWALSGSAVKVLLMCFNEISWLKPKKATVKAKGGRKKITLPREPSAFNLPLSRLEAVGISRSSALRAFQELIKLGFITILEKKSGHPTIYQLSQQCLGLSSIEVAEILGGVKMIPPRERSQAVCGDSDRRKLSVVAV